MVGMYSVERGRRRDGSYVQRLKQSEQVREREREKVKSNGRGT